MTATAVGPACTQPGCTGTIVDGYCDVCGSPGPAAPSARVTSTPVVTAGPPAAIAAGPCTQPGCTGTVVDGYCDVCGSPAGATAASPVEVSPVTQATGVGSTVTRGSSRLGSCNRAYPDRNSRDRQSVLRGKTARSAVAIFATGRREETVARPTAGGPKPNQRTMLARRWMSVALARAG